MQGRNARYEARVNAPQTSSLNKNLVKKTIWSQKVNFDDSQSERNATFRLDKFQLLFCQSQLLNCPWKALSKGLTFV